MAASCNRCFSRMAVPPSQVRLPAWMMRCGNGSTAKFSQAKNAKGWADDPEESNADRPDDVHRLQFLPGRLQEGERPGRRGREKALADRVHSPRRARRCLRPPDVPALPRAD